MSQRFSRNIVTKTKPLPKEVIESFKKLGPIRTTVKIDRLLYIDDEVVPNAFYMEVVLCHEGTSEDSIEIPHVHDVDEILAFVGTDSKNPRDLGGEVELWLDDELHVLKNSCLVFVPAGLKHCPVKLKRIDRPLWFMTLAPMSRYSRKEVSLDLSARPRSEPRYSKYIITEAKKVPPRPPNSPLSAPKMTPILYLDGDVLEGAFYMECVWFEEGAGLGGPPPHVHDFDEILGFIGSDPRNPRDLNGEVELWIDDEPYVLRNSCLVFIPRGVKHCPLIFKRIDKPILHFSTGPSTKYERIQKE